MKKYFVAIVLLLATITAFAQAKHTINKSSVKFQIKNLGVTVEGSFGGVKGDILFDSQHLDASKIEVNIDSKTVNTDNDTRDNHLRSDSYFEATKYPTISMKSVSFKNKSGDNYTGVFSLTIKDKTNQVEVPFTYTENGNTASFKGTFKIKRTDYGVGGKSLVMSNDVTLLITLDTTKSSESTNK
jgi:polyisoprenoid-binding protein YceI